MQMPQYSEAEFLRIVDEIKELSKQIDNLLTQEKKLNLQQIESLDQFYKKKAIPMKILEHWILDEKIKIEIHEKFSKVLREIADNDKALLDRVSELMRSKKNELKELTNNKSLLIYERAK